MGAKIGQPFQPIDASGKTLSVTATSGSVTLGAAGRTMLIINSGTKTCYIRWGNGAQTAVTTDMPMLTLDRYLCYRTENETTLAAICGGSDSTTLLIHFGDGTVI